MMETCYGQMGSLFRSGKLNLLTHHSGNVWLTFLLRRAEIIKGHFVYGFPRRRGHQLFANPCKRKRTSSFPIRAVSNWVSKVIIELLWFCFTTLSDWIKISRHLLNQSDAKPKNHATWSRAFSRRLHVFSLSFHWFIVLFTFVVIGHCNCFGFGFTTLDWKPPYYQPISTSTTNIWRQFDVIRTCQATLNKILIYMLTVH